MKLFFLIGCTMFLSCGTSKKIALNTNQWDAVNSFGTMLQGEYTSEAQAKEDSSYFNIYLAMYPIWTERKDGKWFYVEQAMAAKKEKPYRQRVYQIKNGGLDTIISVIYSFNDPLNFAGAHLDTKKLKLLTFDKLTSKIGCEVYMTKNAQGYEGGTLGKNCSSTLKDAKYATTVITMTPIMLISWDRGFDEEGKQMWGATKGGYKFIKQRNF